MEKVLATVTAIILEFTDIFRNADVYIKGSTPARTRLYQICINRFFPEIIKMFDVFAYADSQWEPFEKNIEYLAFKIVRKKAIILEEPTETYMTKEDNKIQEWIYRGDIDHSPEMVDIENDPYVLRKMADLRKLLEIAPFPEELREKE